MSKINVMAFLNFQVNFTMGGRQRSYSSQKRVKMFKPSCSSDYFQDIAPNYLNGKSNYIFQSYSSLLVTAGDNADPTPGTQFKT